MVLHIDHYPFIFLKKQSYERSETLNDILYLAISFHNKGQRVVPTKYVIYLVTSNWCALDS